jgi:head-tail adaptor
VTFTGLLNQPLTIQHRAITTTDDYGNEVPGTTDSTFSHGYVEQTQATEVTVDRETHVTYWLVVLPPTVTIDATDRIVVGGTTLEVIGKPHQVWNPRSKAYHQFACRCNEVTG